MKYKRNLNSPLNSSKMEKMEKIESIKEIKRYPVKHKIRNTWITPCEMCHSLVYSNEKNKPKKSGFPVYLVCDYCYSWSLSSKDRKYAGVMKSCERPKTSGKKFSKSWTSNYPVV